MEPFLTRPARSSAPPREPRQSAWGRGGGVPGRRSDRRSDSSPAGARRVPVTGHSSTRGEHGTRRDTRSKTGTRTEALSAGTRVGAPDVRGGVAPLRCPSALTLCKGGSGKRTPRNARATSPEPGPLRGHAHVRSTSVAEGRVSAPQPPGTETVCSPSLPRNRLSRASQWCDLNIQLVFTEHTTVNQRKLNVYLKPPLKALLIIF